MCQPSPWAFRDRTVELSARTPTSGSTSPTRKVDDSYANGYANSKWAGEVLLREANELCGLPVAVFRCDMILADTKYVGQLNVPDMFTRLMLSLVASGVAPGSFYETRPARQPATSALRRTARRFHRRGDSHPQRTGGGRVPRPTT